VSTCHIVRWLCTFIQNHKICTLLSLNLCSQCRICCQEVAAAPAAAAAGLDKGHKTRSNLKNNLKKSENVLYLKLKRAIQVRIRAAIQNCQVHLGDRWVSMILLLRLALPTNDFACRRFVQAASTYSCSWQQAQANFQGQDLKQLESFTDRYDLALSARN